MELVQATEGHGALLPTTGLSDHLRRFWAFCAPSLVQLLPLGPTWGPGR